MTAPLSDTVWHTVRRSRIHGNGVFARRRIPAGTYVFEYTGERISSDEADARHPVDPANPFHTFFFTVSNGEIIDAGVNGNDARWVNHSCEPNCAAEESDDNRIFLVTLQEIERGEELLFDYALVIDARYTAKLKAQYQCCCGSEHCRHTMLAPKERKPRVRSATGQTQG